MRKRLTHTPDYKSEFQGLSSQSAKMPSPRGALRKSTSGTPARENSPRCSLRVLAGLAASRLGGLSYRRVETGRARLPERHQFMKHPQLIITFFAAFVKKNAILCLPVWQHRDQDVSPTVRHRFMKHPIIHPETESLCNFFAPKIRKCDKIVMIDAETKPGRCVLKARLSNRNHDAREVFDDHRS